MQSKIDKEILDLKDNYLYIKKKMMGISDDEITNSEDEIKKIELHEIIDINAQDIFKWHLEKTTSQIKSFGKIMQNIITGFYGDM